MRTEILSILLAGGRMGAAEIATAMQADSSTVQAVLHVMDDDGDVLMRGGLYTLSQAARRRMEEIA